MRPACWRGRRRRGRREIDTPEGSPDAGLTLAEAAEFGLEKEHPDYGKKGGKLALPELTGKVRFPTKNAKGQNKTEALFDRKLAERHEAGAIREYDFETMKFRLAKRTWYTPDFPVTLNDWSLITYIEVKGGYIREDGMLQTEDCRRELALPVLSGRLRKPEVGHHEVAEPIIENRTYRHIQLEEPRP